MKVFMTKMEKSCIDYSQKFIRNWEYYPISTGAFLSGYRQALEDIKNSVDPNSIVEVEINEGCHQIGEKISGRKDI